MPFDPSKVIRADRVTRLDGQSKEAVLAEMLEVLARTGMPRAAELLPALLEREALMSTALGHGLAIPHLKTTAVDRFAVVLGWSPTGINFESLDGGPVYLVVLIIGPQGRQTQYLKLLATVSKALMAKREAIATAADPTVELARLLAPTES